MDREYGGSWGHTMQWRLRLRPRLSCIPFSAFPPCSPFSSTKSRMCFEWILLCLLFSYYGVFFLALGSMVGRWRHPFGLKNTFIENLAVQAGINYVTGIPSEFGFMGTLFIHPVHVSIAVAASIDGRVLISGSINELSIPALLGVVRTLGAPIPASLGNAFPIFKLSHVRLYVFRLFMYLFACKSSFPFLSSLEFCTMWLRIFFLKKKLLIRIIRKFS